MTSKPKYDENRRTELLGVKLSAEEVEKKGMELGGAFAKLEALRADNASTKKDMKADEDKALGAVRDLALVVRSRQETRPVYVHDEYDVEAGRVYTVREDNGETAWSRPMTTKEKEAARQGQLFAIETEREPKKSPAL